MSTFLNNDVFMSIKIGFTLANSAYPNEMPSEPVHEISYNVVCLPLFRLKLA